jgi:SAM-dependent methyltransferase
MAENVEYAWVERNLPDEPSSLLNIGSRADKTVEAFTIKGHTIVGIDILPDDREIKNYEFRIGDLLDMTFDEKFDCIYAISSIEHSGLDCYEQTNVDDDGDLKIVEKMFDLLKPGGTMLITIPYGKFTSGKDWRVYDAARLSKLVGDYDHSTTFFLAITEIFLRGWRSIHGSALEEDGANIVYDNMPMIQIRNADDVCSVACVKIQKPMEV